MSLPKLMISGFVSDIRFLRLPGQPEVDPPLGVRQHSDVVDAEADPFLVAARREVHARSPITPERVIEIPPLGCDPDVPIRSPLHFQCALLAVSDLAGDPDRILRLSRGLPSSRKRLFPRPREACFSLVLPRSQLSLHIAL